MGDTKRGTAGQGGLWRIGAGIGIGAQEKALVRSGGCLLGGWMSSLVGSLSSAGPIRILSDLHLGHDLCLVRTVASLRPLIAGAEWVVFNGDTLQERGEAFRERSEGLVAELQELCREEGAGTVFLGGNHDPTAWPLDWLDLLGGRVAATHGDVWLRWISPWSAQLGAFREQLEALYGAAGRLEELDLEARLGLLRRCRLALPPSETRQRSQSAWDRAAFLGRELWPPRRPWEVLKAYGQLPGLAGRFAAAHRPESRVLLFGHTHRARAWRRGGRLLINTGAFVTFARPVLVALTGGQLQAWGLGQEKGSWRPTELLVEESLD